MREIKTGCLYQNKAGGLFIPLRILPKEKWAARYGGPPLSVWWEMFCFKSGKIEWMLAHDCSVLTEVVDSEVKW